MNGYCVLHSGLKAKNYVELIAKAKHFLLLYLFSYVWEILIQKNFNDILVSHMHTFLIFFFFFEIKNIFELKF